MLQIFCDFIHWFELPIISKDGSFCIKSLSAGILIITVIKEELHVLLCNAYKKEMAFKTNLTKYILHQTFLT